MYDFKLKKIKILISEVSLEKNSKVNKQSSKISVFGEFLNFLQNWLKTSNKTNYGCDPYSLFEPLTHISMNKVKLLKLNVLGKCWSFYSKIIILHFCSRKQ